MENDMHDSLGTSVERTEAGLAVRLCGELDGVEVGVLRGLVGDVDSGVLEVDCRGLTFVDSMGLRLLVDWHRRLEGVGGRMVVRDPSEPLRRLLVATGLDAELHVQDGCCDRLPDG